ncbi:glycoside hydrolase family 88 protein [Paenibacillus sp. J5C_2022]|uniref:glycoside hydrolase family 88 protein n=1 Tax=Paenibacillus sp. J5C2022 TaxID=2977129 RepID=UPI0021CE323D|nr:glycoside hydrolase family 88 protein [Paenibacillus sp. J5C2022]MCU6709934.1 glycoside hydrolase family 88 protein [Paenibacillus sp. J5C2022]
MIENKQHNKSVNLWQSAIRDAVDKTKSNILLHEKQFPHITSEKKYSWGENTDWIEGFYTGMVWLCYEYTKDPFFSKSAMEHVDSFRDRLAANRYMDHHDIGFLFLPSAFAAWTLLRDESSRKLALEAADHLLLRWRTEGQYIQAWGPKGDKDNGGRIIIDCMMNIPLLYWASDQTGESKYAEIAGKHADLSRRYLMRGDDSSYHTFYFDPADGSPIRGGTHQGYQDGSTWTRGQAWAIYGFALSYRYTGNPSYLDTARRAAHYFIRRIPEDGVVYWDFDAPVNGNTPRDSSASAIAACGMIEIASHLVQDDPDREFFMDAASRSMASLVEHYSTVEDSHAEGLLRHGSYHVRGNLGPDDFMIWGDYYYLEALLRLEKGIPGYWYERT